MEFCARLVLFGLYSARLLSPFTLSTPRCHMGADYIQQFLGASIFVGRI